MMDRYQGEEPDKDALLKALDYVALLEAEEREAWLTSLAQRDPLLAQRLRQLVEGADSLSELDDGPGLLAEHLTETEVVLPPGTRFGAWRIGELLGTGGMGRVYLGERADGAFEKQVAIKILRHERRLPDAVIEHERALLARLEHPGLAHLLDGGISDDGDIFLVMERVQGEPLDVWCDQNHPSLNQRLDLFDSILDAVAHAHRNLVVHGDLKPGNIYIDTSGRARVLDFGVARMLTSDEQTLPHAITPGWSAPECLQGKTPQVASDIYNLGLLLRALVSHGSQVPDPRMPADLAAIIAHATDDNPEARYQTAMGLKKDVQRFRKHLPVAARQGGRMYLLGRFIRRHWLGTIFASSIFLLLIAAASVFVWQDRIVRSERDAARVAASRSQTVLDYLLGIVGQAGNTDKPVALRSLLNESLQRIDSDFADDPAARQATLVHLSDLLIRLNDFPAAEELLKHFQNNVSPDTPPRLRARALDGLAVVYVRQGKIEEASELVDQGMQIIATLASDSRSDRSRLLVTRAMIQTRQGDRELAIKTLRKALSLRMAVSSPDAAQTVVVRNSLAVALTRSGQLEAALRQYRQIGAALRSSHRQHSFDAANVYGNHASAAFAYGRYREARKMFAKALDLQQDLYGPSAAYAALLNNAGKLNLALGNTAQGSEQIHRAVIMMEKFTGADSLDSILVRFSLGNVALAYDRSEDAIARFAETEQALVAKLGEQHPLLARIRATKLVAMTRSGQLNATDPIFDTTMAPLPTTLGGQRVRAELLCAHAVLALQQRKARLAQDSATACHEIRQSGLDTDSPLILEARVLRTIAAFRLKPDDKHQKALDLAWQALQKQMGADHPTVQRLANLQPSA